MKNDYRSYERNLIAQTEEAWKIQDFIRTHRT